MRKRGPAITFINEKEKIHKGKREEEEKEICSSRSEEKSELQEFISSFRNDSSAVAGVLA